MIKENNFKKAGVAFSCSFLLTFMLLIFGPSEIFFANETEFDFIYSDFIWLFVIMAIITALLATLFLIILPDKLYRLGTSVIFGISLSGYIQVMFLNKDLDLMGVKPEGYEASIGRAIGNLAIWMGIIGMIILLSFWKEKYWKKVIGYGSVFLICIQLVGLISLLVTARDEAYKYSEEKVWHLSGEDQYVVSANRNVIVLILDYFSSDYLEDMYEVYPEATDFLHDFTYYDNMDCTYYGTFPSLSHMLTGIEVDATLSVNEWCKEIWENEETITFYDELSKAGFITNVYTPSTQVLCGINEEKILENKFSNVVYSEQEAEVWNKLLMITMGKMSCYRMFPDIVKKYFYANIDEYSQIVLFKDKIDHENYLFYEELQMNGLHVDNTSNYFIVQHLQGLHSFKTDECGHYKKYATAEETAKGCMVVVEEYINQLKKLGVYDDATIIITADHGRMNDAQVIFFMKEAGETHDISPVTNAPVSFREFLPTIAEAAGLNAAKYGQSIDEFTEDEQRERTVWLRRNDTNYPMVPCYTGEKEGSANVYYGYTYIGEKDDFLKQMEKGPDAIVKMVDSFY